MIRTLCLKGSIYSKIIPRIHYYWRTLLDPSANGQEADLHPGAGLLSRWPLHSYIVWKMAAKIRYQVARSVNTRASPFTEYPYHLVKLVVWAGAEGLPIKTCLKTGQGSSTKTRLSVERTLQAKAASR